MRDKVTFGILFLLVFIAMIVLYQSYLFNIAIAFLICVATFWFKTYLHGFIKNPLTTSLVAITLMIALIFIPIFFICYRAFVGFKSLDWNTLREVFDASKMFIQDLLSHIPFVEKYLPSILNEISFSSLSSTLIKISSVIGENGLKFFIDGFVIVIFLFVFFYCGETFYAYIKRLLPFQDKQIEEVAQEVSGTLRIVFLSTFFNVVMQGTAFGIIAYIYGFEGVLLGILYGICSMIPIVGGVIVWLPVCSILVYHGDIKGAVIVGLYSAVFIGFIIDNIIKPWLIGIVNKRVLSKPLQISEFAIFFAILAGIGAFGFWGIIIGPAITAFFIALLRVYEHDFSK